MRNDRPQPPRPLNVPSSHMRILIICALQLDKAIGSEIRARLICEGLVEHGCSVHVLAPAVPVQFQRFGIGFSRLASDDRRTRRNRIREVIRDVAPEAILLETVSLLQIVYKASGRIPLYVDLHGLASVEALSYDLALWFKLVYIPYALARELLLFRVAGVICANPTLYHWTRRLIPSCLPVIGISGPKRKEMPAPQVGGSDSRDTLRILYIGSHHRYQGTELLLDAYELLLAELPSERQAKLLVGGRLDVAWPSSQDWTNCVGMAWRRILDRCLMKRFRMSRLTQTSAWCRDRRSG